MKIHFIAIGGTAMHNLALALQEKGYEISGSDDLIFEPSLSRLRKKGLLPDDFGWFPEKLSADIDAVILGMHARPDNPELLEARQMGLKIYSYPEFLFEQSKDKIRVVIGGSHGKTSITSMILHVLNFLNIDNDFMVGAQLKGFDTMVRITEEAPLTILEGDEYLSSPIDMRPKFIHYKPQVALLTGIAWDHINVFPTFEIYLQQFRDFLNSMADGSTLIYYEDDLHLQEIVREHKDRLICIPYGSHPHEVRQGTTSIYHEDMPIELKIFGDHNLQNLQGAKEVCMKLDIQPKDFYRAIASFEGAAKRLEKIADLPRGAIFKDFAHSPSKLKATVEAVKKQFPDQSLVACMELHTFSSLSKDFLAEYDGSMHKADVPIVYFSPEAVAHKKLPALSREEVAHAFQMPLNCVWNDPIALKTHLLKLDLNNSVVLLMSSGNFGGMKMEDLADQLTAGITE